MTNTINLTFDIGQYHDRFFRDTGLTANVQNAAVFVAYVQAIETAHQTQLLTLIYQELKNKKQ